MHSFRLARLVVFVYTHFLWNSRYHFRRKTNVCSGRLTRACAWQFSPGRSPPAAGCPPPAISPSNWVFPGTVVLLAYDQLLAEGFAVGRGESGTYLSSGLGRAAPKREARSARLRLSRFGTAAADAAEAVDSPGRRYTPVPYDFAYGRSDIETFPFALWRRILFRHARQAPVRRFDYGPAVRSRDLLEAICAHLRRARRGLRSIGSYRCQRVTASSGSRRPCAGRTRRPCSHRGSTLRRHARSSSRRRGSLAPHPSRPPRLESSQAPRTSRPDFCDPVSPVSNRHHFASRAAHCAPGL